MDAAANMVRRSLTARIAVYLQTGTINMSLYPGLSRAANADGWVSYTHDSTDYAVVPVEINEDYYAPGINIEFLDDVDALPEFSNNKIWTTTVRIVLKKPIEGPQDSKAAMLSLRRLVEKVRKALRVPLMEMWDYDADPPVDSKLAANWRGQGLLVTDESLPIAGGDVQLVLTFNVTYHESF